MRNTEQIPEDFYRKMMAMDATTARYDRWSKMLWRWFWQAITLCFVLIIALVVALFCNR